MSQNNSSMQDIPTEDEIATGSGSKVLVSITSSMAATSPPNSLTPPQTLFPEPHAAPLTGRTPLAEAYAKYASMAGLLSHTMDELEIERAKSRRMRAELAELKAMDSQAGGAMTPLAN